MSERTIIAAGILLFLGAAAFPFWRSAVAPPHPLNLVLPAGQHQCIAPIEEMRGSHGDILEDWRDRVVRNGEHTFTAPGGHVRELSLERTCLDCHEKAGFCDRCHHYVAVTVECWSCHADPRGRT